jgi:hypothetical protein
VRIRLELQCDVWNYLEFVMGFSTMNPSIWNDINVQICRYSLYMCISQHVLNIKSPHVHIQCDFD